MGVSLFETKVWFLVIFCFFMFCFCGCDGRIASLNGKYSQFYSPKSLEIEKDNGPVYGSMMDRVRREADPSSKVIVDESVLEGTEKLNQAIVHWIGKDTSEKVVVLTCRTVVESGTFYVNESKLWRSDDYGSSYKNISLGYSANISSFFTFSTNPQKLLFTDVKAKKVYTTEDEMEHFKEHAAPVEPDLVVPHPVFDEQILVYSFTEKKLYASHDFAESWQLLGENVMPNFFWGTPGYDKDLNIVHMEIVSSTPDQAEYRAVISPSGEDVTDQMGLLGPFMANTLIVYKEFMIVEKTYLNGSDHYLMVSYKRQPFSKAYFPGDVKAKDFILLNLDDSQVFVAVVHEKSVNLYLSDPTGHFFVLSFSDVFHRPHISWLEIDLHEVQGMNWTFMVNKRVPNTWSVIESYISFDKGGNWGKIPLSEELKKECKSKDATDTTTDCSLQLHIGASRSASIISSKTAPGIIVAHGVLASSKQSVQLNSIFTSRDGGWTWRKASFNGSSYHLNILDQGSILTAIPKSSVSFSGSRVASKTLYYSCNEGATWEADEFDKEGLPVIGVETEPGMLTMVETLFGNNQKNSPWVLLKLNFSQVLAHKCQEKDYESWFPQDYNDVTQNNCTMGRLIQYKRRRQDAKCFNGEMLIPRLLSNDSCECTREDYECDFGYEEKGLSCHKSDWFTEGYLPVVCTEDSYSKSQGYRKVSSDVCEEKEAEKKKYGPVESKCEAVKPRGLSISTHTSNVAVGKEVTLYLAQDGGSVDGTNYTWTLGDDSPRVNYHDYSDARKVKHIYKKSGHFTVKVVATNAGGTASAEESLHVQDKLSYLEMVSPLAGKTGLPVTLSVMVGSRLRPLLTTSDHAHFMWSFGDETSSSKPLLTWSNSVTHSYTKAGVYQVSVEAVNSVGALLKKFEMRIYDNVEVLLLKFGETRLINISNPIINRLAMQWLRYQVADDLGLALDRVTATPALNGSGSALLYIYPSDDPQEEDTGSIKERFLALVKDGNFGFSLLGRRSDSAFVIPVTSAETYIPPVTPTPPSGNKSGHHGPNLTALYICAPVLVLAVLVSLGLLIYCQRKRRGVARPYNVLQLQDDSDPLLDDDDEAPLDLNINFRGSGRGGNMDEPILDSGGGHLVMQDNAENC